jgi:hypothetical protein
MPDTTWTIRPLPGDELADIYRLSCVEAPAGDGPPQFNQEAHKLLTLEHGLVGWSGVQDEAGADLAYDRALVGPLIASSTAVSNILYQYILNPADAPRVAGPAPVVLTEPEKNESGIA